MSSRRSSGWPAASPNMITFGIVVLVTFCLAVAKPVVLPAAMAVLLAFVLNPFVALLDRRGVPRVPAVFIVVVVAGVLVGTLAWLLTSQVVAFLNELPSYQDNVARRVAELRAGAGSKNSIVSKVEVFIETVTSAATAPLQESAKAIPSGPHKGETGPGERGTKSTEEPQPVKVVNSQPTTQLGPWVTTADTLLEFLASVGLVIVLVIYMLINREDIRNRFLRLTGERQITMATKALDDAAKGLSGYLLAQLMVNASFGVVVGLGVWLVGLPYPLLWGVCATFLRYIPFIGPWLALLFPLALSLAIMPGWTRPLIIVALFVAFELAANLAIEPLLYGHRMGVSPAPLLIAIAFWSWLWGVMGLVLAVPLTVCLVVLGKHVPPLRFFDILLGDEPALTVDVNFYQRLLARDEEEAFEIAREQLGKTSLIQVFDEILIPAVINARGDFQAEAISREEVASILEMIREVAEECASVAREPAAPPSTADAQGTQAAKLSVLVCAARDAADETAIEMLRRVLDPNICEAEYVTTDRLVSEIVAVVDRDRPAVVCIVSLPPGGLAHTRLLCKRLRQQYPSLKIVVGRWGLKTSIEQNREDLTGAGAGAGAGADSFGTTIRETCTQVVQLSHFLRPAAPAVNERPTASGQSLAAAP